jgi:hypothetical protein
MIFSVVSNVHISKICKLLLNNRLYVRTSINNTLKLDSEKKYGQILF